MENVEVVEQSIEELVKSGYGQYQQFVNDGKFIPGLDGLKYVQRRYLLSVKDVANSKFQKSSFVLGNAMGKWHPHEHQPEVLNSLVRMGLVAGQGNFGTTSMLRNISGASMRYTEVKYNKDVDNILFKFEDYFLMKDGENGYPEPEFLITPIPIALMRGAYGIGVGGVYCDIPAFTYESLLEAYAEDNPLLLKSAYGLEIDYEKSDMDSLWNIGHGKLILKFHVEKLKNGVVRLSGNATPFKPNLKRLMTWESQNLLSIVDESTEEMNITFERKSNIRRISDKDIYEEVSKVAIQTGLPSNKVIMYSNRGKVVKTGLKTWIDFTMKLYKSTFNSWKSGEISKRNRQIDLYNLIPEVAKLLQEGKTSKEISGIMNRTIKTIRKIEGLPIRMLRKTDFNRNIKTVEAQIKDIEKVKVDDLINCGKVIDELLGLC